MKTILIPLIFCLVLAGQVSPCLGQTVTLDAYGGWEQKHFDIENNGFFKTTFQEGKWWLVTPENNAFLSLGLNHFHADLWQKDYNKAHWEEEFGGPAKSEAWANGFYNYAREVVEATQANTMAYHNEEPALLSRPPLLPYIKQFLPVKISFHMRAGVEDYVDVFAPEFRKQCDEAVLEQVAPYVEDKMIIGFAMTDIPVLTEGWAKYTTRYGFDIPTWARVLRNLPQAAPGKQAYVAAMQERYASIAAFNTTYAASFSSWDALLTAENWRPTTDFENPEEVADNNAFDKVCIRKYYEVTSTAFRAVDPNHLFLGDKLNANVAKEDLEIMVDAVKDYVDVVLYQFFGMGDYQGEYQQLIATTANLPMMNGDGGFGAFGDPRMPNPQNPQAKDQDQRAEWMYQYAETAFSHPNFVGWHICGVIDSWSTAPHGTQKAGIMNPVGEPHNAVIQILATLSKDVYRIREGVIEPRLSQKGDE